MGQYLNKNKIGTCENMYYLTLAEARALAEKGARDDDGITFKEYLEDNETRFRFAWPDEDDQTFETHGGQRDAFKTFQLPCPVEIEHYHITFHNTHFGGGYGINIMIPCPHSAGFNLEMSNGGAGEQFVCVEFQAIRDGQEKTIFKCARCGQSQRFDDADVAKIRARAIEYYSVYNYENGNIPLYNYAMKVIERIK